jgi:hypothetical protein
MKRLAFVIAGVAALTLGACNNSNPDAVNNAELNQPSADDLNALSNQAAMDAANREATQTKTDLNDENAAAEQNATNQQEADEQNVSGM